MKKDNKNEKRIEDVEILSEKLKNEGYSRKDLTTGSIAANTVAYLYPLPIAIIYGLIYCLSGNHTIMTDNLDNSFLLFLFFVIVSMVVHEGLHGLTWSCFAPNGLKDIEFGIAKISPYCYCKACLKYRNYIIGMLMPLFVLGFGLAIVSYFFNSTVFFLVVIVNIFATSGDISVVLKMIKNKSNEENTLYHDHPKEAGVIKFYK